MNKREFMEAYLFATLGEETAWQGASILEAAEKAWDRLERVDAGIASLPTRESPVDAALRIIRGHRISQYDADRIIQQIKFCISPEIS